MEQKIAVNSNTYHGFSLEEAVRGIADAGFRYIELTATQGWTEHVFPDQPMRRLMRVQDMLADAGLIPFAMSGAFLALFITNTSLSMTSFLGLIVLVGTVVNNSILLVEFINQNKKIMGRDEALVQAGSLRLRPILMSAGTTVVGMIPMSLGIGEGGELLAPLGISIIGGLIASTVVTLFLIPVLYAIIDDRRMKRAAKRRRKAKKIAALEAKWAKEDALNV